VAHPITLSRYS